MAVDFFRRFSRTEYALKAAGWLATNGGDAKVDWDRYADSVADRLAASDDTDLLTARAYLLDHPPKKQIVSDGLLAWSAGEPKGQSETRRLIIYLRRVRNNLFHGGKFNGRWFDPQRSSALLEASLVVLTKLVDIDDDVRAAFESH